MWGVIVEREVAATRFLGEKGKEAAELRRRD
jgi:hypothetical protein